MGVRVTGRWLAWSPAGFRLGLGIALALMLLSPAPGSAADRPVRIALTAAAVRDELPFYDRWAAYLGRKLGQPVEFVQRRSYRDTIEMLKTGELDFSWICSYSFIQAWDADLVDLVATPLFRGKPLYQSYIIVHRDSAATDLMELERKAFAYTDPDSNTGYVVPRAMLRGRSRNPDGFFRATFFTWDHGQAIEAVAEKVADGAAVDSYVWEYLAAQRPRIAERTKIIQRSDDFGFPPMVARRGIPEDLRRRFTEAVLTMEADPEGRMLLAEMMLDGFVTLPQSHYDRVRAMSPARLP